MLVKRLVCIEDLGDVDVLFTDKTGTLTEGRINFTAARRPAGAPTRDACCAGAAVHRERPPRRAVMSAATRSDAALWESPARGRLLGRFATTGSACCRSTTTAAMTSVARPTTDGTALLVTKGAPETVLARCVGVPAAAQATLAAEFAAGNRVVAVAAGPRRDLDTPIAADDEQRSARSPACWSSWTRPRRTPRRRLRRLAGLGIAVKVVTGDNPAVAVKVCARPRLAVRRAR